MILRSNVLKNCKIFIYYEVFKKYWGGHGPPLLSVAPPLIHGDVLKKKSHTNDVFILTKVTLTLTFEERLVSERDVSTLGEKKDTG